MKREFNPISRRVRMICACGALMATAVVAGSLVALVEHYDNQYLQVARSQSAIPAQYVQAPAAGPAKTAHHG